jgi:hypothetical protein
MACDNLYVVVVERTFFDPTDPARQVSDATVPATCTTLKAAEEEAKMALIREGYETQSFLIYDVNDGCDEWKHGDDTIVYAETKWGEVLKVAIDTIPNTHRLRAGRSGRVEQLPYHILQTVIE